MENCSHDKKYFKFDLLPEYHGQYHEICECTLKREYIFILKQLKNYQNIDEQIGFLKEQINDLINQIDKLVESKDK